MSVRLTVDIARIKGLPHAPETALKGHRATEVVDSWPKAIARAAAVYAEAVSSGRTVNRVTITDLAVADRNFEHGAAEG